MLTLAYSIFLTNVLFGLAVRARVIDSSRFRFVHHGIYFLVMASLIGAAAVAAWQGRRVAYALGLLTALLFAMPRFPGKGRGHAFYALFCLAAYSAVVIWGAD